MRGLICITASALLVISASSVTAADDFKVIKLEQDVRNLEGQVRELTREVDELRAAMSRADGRSAPHRSAPASQPTSSTWLSAESWNRVRTGMSELEVINVLGLPASMRTEGETRVLLYAMEIAPNGFLSGSVTLKERRSGWRGEARR